MLRFSISLEIGAGTVLLKYLFINYEHHILKSAVRQSWLFGSAQKVFVGGSLVFVYES